MATYLKRTSKLFDISMSQASTEMNLRDVICPVCRGILIEPVTLPCTHNLCLRCLKGTFEHNSLSCPLCRIRVGSWLRSATKSETLVNSELWDLIKSRFPKEIEGKHNDDDNEITTDDTVYPPKIISAAGEIRREYEIQLQIAEEELRRQHESEIMANEALIRKFHEEEEKKLAQYAQDQLLAKSLAKKQLLNKGKNVKFYNNCMNIKMPSDEVEILPLNNRIIIGENNSCTVNERTNNTRDNDIEENNRQTENYTTGKFLINKKGCCPGQLPIHSVVTLKHQSTMLKQNINSNYSEPSCSNSKIYGTRSEEELRVPSDVLSSNKKSLGIEICVTTINNDNKRIGSAESAGSHDSINQEIHHFKPIKAMPRTPLRVTQDGRQVDPKLIRVVPITKRLSNVVPKAPSPSHFKRIVGCSWSAFRGKIQHNPETSYKSDWRGSCTFAQSYQSSKLTKPETVRKIDLAHDLSFDNNKNYTKGINRIINGTKVCKKLILDDETDDKSRQMICKTQINNCSYEKGKKYKIEKDENELSEDENYSPIFNNSSKLNSQSSDNNNDDDNDTAIENIAERIKRRKVGKKIDEIDRIEIPTKSRSSNTLKKETESKKSKRKLSSKASTKSKRLRVKFNSETEVINPDKIEDNNGIKRGKVTRKSTRTRSKEACDSVDRIDEVTDDNLDESAIKEQEKMERLLLQEKEDFELAQRLQAEFDGMESISCRTRRSKRAHESGDVLIGIEKMRINSRLLENNVSTAKPSSRGRRKQKRE